MEILQYSSIKSELLNLLSAYLVGWKNISDCSEWLSSLDWEKIDKASTFAIILGELDVLCTEILEGMRSESEFEIKVSDFVASKSCVRYSVPRTSIMISGSSTATTDNRTNFTVAVDSQELSFWNISPQVAPA